MYSVDDLIGENAYVILSYVVKAMKNEGKSQAEIDAFVEDAKSSNYENLCACAKDMIEILNADSENKSLQYENMPYDDLDDEDFDDEEYFVGEGREFPAYDDVQIDLEEERTNVVNVKKLVPLQRNEKCLYMTPADFEAEEINVKQIARIIKRTSLIAYICDGCLELVFNNNNDYEFYKEFDKQLKMELHTSVNALAPYIYDYDEMQPIIRESFRKNL